MEKVPLVEWVARLRKVMEADLRPIGSLRVCAECYPQASRVIQAAAHPTSILPT